MNYLVLFLRNIIHHKLYTSINLLGLAIGLSAFTFIALYIFDELSFDKHHKNFKQIYRLESDITISGKQQRVAKSSFAIGPAFLKEFPEVEAFVRFRAIDNCFLTTGNKKFYEDLFYYCDSSVFNVFTHDFIAGSPIDALTEPNTIVITESIAMKYFGTTRVLNKIINVSNRYSCRISGVIKDVPKNSHLHFSGLVSMQTYSQIIGEEMYRDLGSIHFWAIRLFTYIKLKEGSNIGQIHYRFPDFHDTHIAPISERMNGTFNLLTSRLDRIHLYNDTIWDLPKGNIRTIYILYAIALFILLIAGINYMNLATAQSVQKSKIVGIRKIVGANRFGLSCLFISESIFLSFLAFLVSSVLIEALLPYFNHLTGKSFVFELSKNIEIFTLLFITSFLIGLFSSLYPALYMASFPPLSVIHHKKFISASAGKLRKALIIFQFSVATALIAGAWIVTRQMNFLQDYKLGFNKDNLLIMRSADSSFKSKYPVFKNNLLENTSIINITTSNTLPGLGSYLDVFLVEGKEGMEKELMSEMFVDYNFIDMMGMTLIQGRSFSMERKTDSEQSIIINRSATEILGWGSEAIGKEIHQRSSITKIYKVIGVVDDFHFTSLYEKIGPLVFFLSESPQDFISLRINPHKKHEALAVLEATWDKLNPGEPLKYDFLDDLLKDLYSTEYNFNQVITIFAILSLFISSLGLFGLASFIIEKSSKNIGIRKLLGASIRHIVFLMSKEFISLILISFLIGMPVAWYSMERWLAHFAYRVDLHFYWFVIAGLLVLGVSQITVIIQTIRAANTNPVKVIGYE